MGRLLLLGYFGAGNLGDDALLVDWLKRWQDELRQHNQICDVSVAGDTHRLNGFAEAWDLLPLLGRKLGRRALLTAKPWEYEALVIPGGSLLQNVTSTRSLLFYLHIISHFANFRTPVFMLGQGLGPFKGKLAESLVPLSLKGVKLLALRDTSSFQWARDHLASAHAELCFSADPILAGRLQPTDSRPELIKANGYCLLIPKAPKSSAESNVKALVAFCESVQTLSGSHTQIRAFQDGRDRELADDISTRTGAGAYGNAASGLDMGLIAHASIVVSYRLHGVIMAAGYGVPALGVAYDPKVSAFCAEMGLPYCTPQDQLDGKAIELVRELWHNRAQVRATMLERRAIALERLAAAEARFAELLWGAR